MPPAWFRFLEVWVLMRVVSRAFDVEPPRAFGLPADRALLVFREFTAACMEMAADDAQLATFLRARLGIEALHLGDRIRRLLRICPSQALGVARYFYRGIGIELDGSLPAASGQLGVIEQLTDGQPSDFGQQGDGQLAASGKPADGQAPAIGRPAEGQPVGELRFGPCSFSARYSPHDCWVCQASTRASSGVSRGIIRQRSPSRVGSQKAPPAAAHASLMGGDAMSLYRQPMMPQGVRCQHLDR